ncbi:MAG: ATP-binding protein [Lysobacterales bacterium]
MTAVDWHLKMQRVRLLALVALLCWLLAGVVALVGVPTSISIGISVLGLVLAAAVWYSLGAVLASSDSPQSQNVGAPGRAFEAVDPTAVFEREGEAIERQRDVENQLRAAKHEAEAATLAKGEFLATMSHEIRTPLNGIVPPIDVVLSSTLNTDQRQCLETAYASAQQLVSIVDDILDYSKIEANRLELESVSINLRELVDSVAQLMAHPAQAKGVSLSVRFDPNVRPIHRGDPVRLRQVLTNLVSNAVKFTDRGSVTVQVGRRGETPTHTQILFAIVDTGPGIDQQAQKRLFQPFMQADNSVTRVFGGTGLGLAICRRLVEIMGGEIGVKSEPGHGSTFWFSVPVLKAPGDIATVARGVTGTRALVVSADQALIRDLAAFFASADIQHTQTSLSSDAVSRLRGNPNAPRGAQASGYQYAFLDWTGMRLTAQSMARGLLRDPSLAHLRIVLLTQPQDELPDDLRRHPQVLIHPRVFEAAKLSAALDSDGKAAAPLKTVEDLLRTGSNDARSEIVAPSPSAPTGGDSFQRRAGDFDTAPPVALQSSAALRSDVAPKFAQIDEAPLEALPAAPAAPRRVLLVEDNPVNRQVAQRLLSISGLTVDVAEEGASALAQRFAHPPLLIMMDCQMPVMDGYASTRAIREREAREGLPRMPIIAMTANAMLGDREKCLQSGMDDYLSKPLDRKALALTLDRWLAVSEGRTTVMAKRREVVSFDSAPEVELPVTAPAQILAPVVAAAATVASRPVARLPPVAPPQAAAPPPRAEETATAPPLHAIDNEIIDDLIDMMGDDFADLVRIYLHDAPVHVAELHAAAQRNDLQALIAPAHILKSSSANLGALALAEHARTIESGARQGQLPQLPIDMTEQLERAYLEASSELTRLLILRGD